MSGPFTECVMAAVAMESRPTPTRAFLSSVAHLSFRDAAAALATGWRLATVADRTITPRGQVSSSAVLITIVAVLAVGGSFAAADRLLAPSMPGPAAQGPAPELLGGGAVDLPPAPSPEPGDPDLAVDADRSTRERPPHAARENGGDGGRGADDGRREQPGDRDVERPKPKLPEHRVVRHPADREDEGGDDRDRGGDRSGDGSDGEGPDRGGSGDDGDGGGESEGSD